VHAHVKVTTRPAEISAEAKNAGFAIKRTYLNLSPDGTMKEASEFEVGDLVVVRLDLEVPVAEQEYLAIDDPLPSIFESVNPVFKGRGEREAQWTGQELPLDFQEMRTDRTLFFCNYLAAQDNYRWNTSPGLLPPVRPPRRLARLKPCMSRNATGCPPRSG